MAESRKSFNPFTSIGRYNIESYLYEHKNIVLSVTIMFIFLLIGLAFFVGSKEKRKPRRHLSPNDLPPPKYGYGPYGYGMYAPPREMLENPPSIV